MHRPEQSIVTHVAITWGDDYPLLATQVPRGETFVLGGEGEALALCTPGPWVLVDEHGRFRVPAGATLERIAGGGASSASPTPAQGVGSQSGWLELSEGDRFRMQHGGLCFFVEATRSEARSWGRVLDLSRSQGAFWALSASLVFHGIFLALGALLPPTAAALSMDLSGDQLARARYLIEATEDPPPEPTWLGEQEGGGEDAAKADGAEGEAGALEAPDTQGRRSEPRGPAKDSEPRPQASEVREAGILRALAAMGGAAGNPLFDPQSLDPNAARVMGDLFGDVVGANSGFGGLGMRNTGRGGGGDALGTRGTGELATHGGPGVGTGRGAPLGVKRGGGSGPPKFRTRVELSGSLSKEAIRRTIRRRANEVRHCYEQGLRKRPDLAGRVSVFFVVQPDGSVGSAALRSSSLEGGQEVERCIVQAVRRWPFPQPSNGGIVSVTYPFMLQSGP